MVKLADVTTDLFLTRAELKDLTGYDFKSKQITHLRDHGIPHFISATGNPRVSRSILSGPSKERRSKPNLSGLSRAKTN